MEEPNAPEKWTETPVPPLRKAEWREVAAQELAECGEELVPASLVPERILVRPQYYIQGLEGALPESFLRRSVLRRLLDASAGLPAGFKLVILDGWRPVELQQRLFGLFVEELRAEHPGSTEEELHERARRFVAQPRPGGANHTPHATGGAVDLTIVDANGEMLPMGTDFDEMTERSLTRHFEERVERGEILSASEQEALRNRRLLYHLMTRAGFTNFPNEWWHFDFGNKVWSCMRGGKAGPAVYGAAEPHFRWRPAGGRALPAKARPVEHRAHREPVAEVRTGRTFTTTKERKRAMVIGVPKEVKTLENRVALTPGAVQVLVRRGGHEVRVESGAGLGSGIHDHEYEEAGAKLVRAEETWEADLVVKVKEPVDWEYKYLREDLILYTYLHLAADRPLTERLMESKTTAIAYETVELPNGTLPLLTPMSEVAGRMATQVGAHFLEKPQNGRGVLLGGVPGVVPGTVMILGAGVVGNNAAKVAVGLGANVFMFDVDHRKLQYLDDVYQGRINTVSSNEANIRALLPRVDLLIGAVLLTGARAPRLVTRNMLSAMKEGSVIVDVSVDQGGCVETIEPTTHAEPTYVVEGVVHYGVANMPGAVPRTSTFALVNQTLPYCLRLAEKGLDALREDPSLAKGLNTYAGRLTYPAVGEAFDLPTVPVEEVLK